MNTCIKLVKQNIINKYKLMHTKIYVAKDYMGALYVIKNPT